MDGRMEVKDQTQNFGPNIVDLPPEVISAIADLGGNKSNLRIASKYFFNAIVYHFNLGLIKPTEMEKLAQIFGRYQKPIGLTFNKPEMLSAKDMAHLTTLTRITSLCVKPIYIDGSIFVHLTNLVSLEVESVTASASHISSLTKLPRLNFKNRSDEWPDMRNNIVTSLTVISEKTLGPKTWFDQFIHLQSLHMELSGHSIQQYRLLTNVCNKLTSLSLHRIVIENKDCIPWHQLRALSIEANAKEIDYVTLESIAKSTNLTSLKIKTLSNQQQKNQLDLKELKKLKVFELIIMKGLTPIPEPIGSVKDILSHLNKETLIRLHLEFWHDQQACMEEISKMIELKECSIKLGGHNGGHEVDLSAIMTMTQLTSLMLSIGQCKGLQNVTNLTDLKLLEICADNDNNPMDTIQLSKFANLTSLDLVNVAREVDIRGLTTLEKLKLHNVSNGLRYYVSNLCNLKLITLSKISTKIPWTELAKSCAKLQSILIDSFDSDDSVLALQNLKYLTKIGNVNTISQNCAHFTVDQLTHLTRLQIIDITVPTLNVTRQKLEEKLPMMLFFKERMCMSCKMLKPQPEIPMNTTPPFGMQFW